MSERPDPDEAGEPEEPPAGGLSAGDALHRSREEAAWARAGVPHDDVAGWRRWRIEPADARAWRAAGVTDGLTAAQWETARVTPRTVRAWVAEGISPTEAVRWHEFGFGLEGAKAERAQGRSPTQALEARAATHQAASARAGLMGGSPDPNDPVHRFLQGGGDHRLLHDYMQHRWVDESAIAWARQGIGASDAYLWHDIGLTAEEAGRLVAGGQAIGDVVRTWWATGIPFDEVADWIGAGLSPAEAVAQRAAGVTAEEAAALRALRRDEAPPPRPGASGPAAELSARMGPPGTERPGPPPRDQEGAKAAIVTAFEEMLVARDDGGGLARVEGGNNLGPSIMEARRRVGGGTGSTTSVRPTAVRFVNDHQARVLYDVDVNGGLTSQLQGRLGAAVLVDGEWKVTRDTVVDLLRLAGVHCPPPPPS